MPADKDDDALAATLDAHAEAMRNDTTEGGEKNERSRARIAQPLERAVKRCRAGARTLGSVRGRTVDGPKCAAPVRQ